jgi:hypothetical protein
MLSITQAALSAATVCCVIGTADPFVLGVSFYLIGYVLGVISKVFQAG